MPWYTQLLGAATLVFIGLGGFLLHEAVSDARWQPIEVLVGAFLMALGFLAVVAEGRSLFRWWRTIRSNGASQQ